MKKTLIILIAVMSLFAKDVMAEDFDTLLTENKNSVFAAIMFSALYTKNGDNGCENGYISAPTRNFTKDQLAMYQNITEPNVKLKCFVANGDKLSRGADGYYDNSDECILARRNTKKSTVCWFNYKKYASQNSKTKTDEEFWNLVSALNFYFDIDINGGFEDKFCVNKREATSTEKQQCLIDVGKFLMQLDEGKAPHCRDKENNAYYTLLKDGKQFLNMVDNTSIVHRATGYEQQNETILYRTIYSDIYGRMFIHNVKEFGYKHLCDTAGFENDIEISNKGAESNSSERQGNIVELN